MYYRKYIDEHTLAAPPKVYRGDGEVILNFDTNPAALVAHEYYPVQPEPVIPEGCVISSESSFSLITMTEEQEVELVTPEELDKDGNVIAPAGKETREVSIDASYIAAKWRYDRTDSPQAEARDVAECQIVKVIYDLAKKYDAFTELYEMENVSIPSLIQLAVDKGVSQEDLQQTMTTATVYALQLLAVTGGTWAAAWDALKIRFGELLEDIAQAETGDVE